MLDGGLSNVRVFYIWKCGGNLTKIARLKMDYKGPRLHALRCFSISNLIKSTYGYTPKKKEPQSFYSENLTVVRYYNKEPPPAERIRRWPLRVP